MIFLRRGVVLLCFSMIIRRASAQDVLAPPPQMPATPSAVQDYQDSNPMQVFAPAEQTKFSTPLQWGLLNVHPHLDYQFLYGNGIESSPGESQDTIVQEVSPGILFNLGDHWTLDYTPTLNFYSSSSFQNTVDESVRLNWGTAYNGDWFFSGSQSYTYSSDPTIQTAAQTDQKNYSTVLNASWQINDKIGLDMGLNQNLNYVGNGGGSTNELQSLANSKTWSTMDWLNYQFWPRLGAGLGIGLGYNTQAGSPDSIYEQYQVRINWRATDKLSFQVGGGLYDQQYLGGGAGDLLTPIFNATIQYLPFGQTRLSVNASRSVSPSYFQNQTTENTVITADLNQRLLGKLYLDLNGGFSTAKYDASLPGLSTSRNDDVYSFSARLSCPIRRLTASVFYSYSENSSSQAGFATSSSAYAYTSHQIGFEIGYRY